MTTEPGHPDPCSVAWYVTDPSTSLTQYVEADAECTARWVAWSAWRGAAPADERDEADYASLQVIPAGQADDCGLLNELAPPPTS